MDCIYKEGMTCKLNGFGLKSNGVTARAGARGRKRGEAEVVRSNVIKKGAQPVISRCRKMSSEI